MSDETKGTNKTKSRRSVLRLAVPAAAGVAALAATGAGEMLHAPSAHAANGDAITIGQVNTGTGLTQLNNAGSNSGMFWMIDEAAGGNSSYALAANSQHNTGFYGVGGDSLLSISALPLNKATNGVYGIASHSNNDDGLNNTGYGVVAHANNANAPLLLISNRTGAPNNASANGSITVDGANGSLYNVRYNAWYPLSTVNLLAAPIRLVDTRGGAPITNGNSPLAGGATLVAQVTGTSVGGVSVPAHATAVIANMTSLPFAAGDLTIWADGVTRPSSSNLNYTAGINVANFVICALSPAGKVDIFAHVGATHVILDVAGYII